MSFWPPGKTVGLALAGGFFACSLLAGERIQFSIAGINSDKIEFSAPAAPINMPVIIKEEKDQSRWEYHPSDTSDRLFMEDNDQASLVAPDVVVVNPVLKRNNRSPDSAFGNPEDKNDPNADSSDFYDRLRPRVRSIDDITNRWDQRNQFNENAQAFGYDSRIDDATRQDNPHRHLNAVTSSANDEANIYGDGQWRNPNSNSSHDSAWSLGYYHHELSGSGQSRDGEVWPSYSEMLAAASRAGDPLNRQSAIPTVGQDLRNARQPGVVVDKYAPRNANGVADQTATTFGVYNYPGTTIQDIQNPYSVPRPRAAIVSSQPREVPAILPFPRRPGDVFHPQ